MSITKAVLCVLLGIMLGRALYLIIEAVAKVTVG